MALKILIPLVFLILALLLVKYDRNKELKSKHISWFSLNIFRDKSGFNSSAALLHQTVLGFLFIFCVGIAILFIIGFFG